MPMRLFYAESSQSLQTTNTGAWNDIVGLTLTLPKSSGDEKFALVTLNVPNPYAKGNDYPGCNFAIHASVPGSSGHLKPVGCFTSFNKVADPATAISSGRVPVTVVGRVMLHKDHPTLIQGQWQSVRGATAVLDTAASISAVTGKG